MHKIAAQRSLGYVYVVVAAALWALLGPVARLAFREGVTPLEVAFWRCVIAWALFAVHVAVVSRRAPVIARRDAPGIVAFGLVGIAALYAALPLAVQAGGAALAVILLYTAPAWVALFAWGAFGERLDQRKLIALSLTLLGVGGIALAGTEAVRPSGAAIGWGLVAGGSYASLYFFGKRYFARYTPATVFLYTLPVAAMALLPLTTFHRPSPSAWAALLTIGLCSTYGAYLAYSAGLARMDVTRAATIATAEPVIGAFLAFMFWNERFTLLGYGAATLVLIGVLTMASTPETRASQ